MKNKEIKVLLSGGNRDVLRGCGCVLQQNDQTADALVGLGFRYWMAGYQNHKFDYWTHGWKFFTDELGAANARPVVTALAAFVQEVHCHAKRPIEVALPGEVSPFCRDECKAIALVAACQTEVCPALQACAQALIGDQDPERVICASSCFANKLADFDLLLSGVPALVQTGLANDTAMISG